MCYIKPAQGDSRRSRSAASCHSNSLQEQAGAARAALGLPRTFPKCSIRISTTMFWNLMFIIAATVSSCARMRVGPKITPMLDGDIRFSRLCSQTLQRAGEGGIEFGLICFFQTDLIPRKKPKTQDTLRISHSIFFVVFQENLFPSSDKHGSSSDTHVWLRCWREQCADSIFI